MLTIILPSYNEPNIVETLRKCKVEFPDAHIIIAQDNTGRGKGWAVMKGLLASNDSIVCFLDGDGDIEPRMLKRLLPFLKDFDIVVGAKNYTNLKFSRRIITQLSRLYIKLMFGLDFTTQTGIKVMKRSAIVTWVNKGFMFDLEFLVTAYRSGFKIIEVPVEAKCTKSKSWRTLWKALIESIVIWFRSLSL